MILDRIVNQPVIETDRFDLRPLRKSDKGRSPIGRGTHVWHG